MYQARDPILTLGYNNLVKVPHYQLQLRDKRISLDHTLIMGVVNVTPDSFSGDGQMDPGGAVAGALRLWDQGADIIDVGGESSRPGAVPVSEADELARVMPVVQELANHPNVIISVDTAKPAVAEAALGAGAHIINDIYGLTRSGMAEVVARHQAAVIIMHMQGTPQTMQDDPYYNDVVGEIGQFFEQQIRVAKQAGIGDEQIILDPGIGFGKTLEHNLEILRRLPELKRRFNYPLLVGTSRKGFIGKLTAQTEPQNRIYGTAASVALAITGGANLVRVHDVVPMRDVVAVAEAIAGRASK